MGDKYEVAYFINPFVFYVFYREHGEATNYHSDDVHRVLVAQGMSAEEATAYLDTLRAEVWQAFVVRSHRAPEEEEGLRVRIEEAWENIASCLFDDYNDDCDCDCEDELPGCLPQVNDHPQA